MSGEKDRIPPHNIEAEKAVLGACLLDKDAIVYVLDQIKARDFYRDDHQVIFQCMVNLSAKGEPCDLVTVVEELRKQDNLERAGGVSYIATLADAVPSATAAVHYSKIVAETSLTRDLIHAAGEILAEGYAGSKDAHELLMDAEKAIFDVSNRKVSSNFDSIKDLSLQVFEQILEIKASDGVTGIPTFTDLDRILSGLQKGDLIILAARPGMGKTSFAMNIAQQAGCKYGKTVAVFSLEMPNEQLVQRMLCTQAKVDQSKVRKGMLSGDEAGRLSAALGPLSEANIFMDDTPGITITEMRAKARRLILEQGKLDLLVVDYLQLMQGSRRIENRQQEISEISRSLKALAKELDVPVLALSQLSRLVERTNEPPNLSHLRESGALEQDADVVLFIHQPKSTDDEGGSTPQSLVEVIVAKHRNGSVGSAQLAFFREYTRFADYSFVEN
ncbi:MAG: replicative DNA helicase [Peptococcaceae bacterium]|jgi:replicative DNA helicase|nr:replicative DNA helicase [Peptococcaceae bacterium]